MDSPGPWADLLAAAARHFEDARPFFPMYGHLIVSALFPIYTGAHASLSRPSSAAKPKKKGKKSKDAEESDDEEEDDEVEQKMEGLSPSDAIIFPITAGLVLTGLYFLIKRYGADLINLILGWYFAGVGIYSVGRLINDAAGIAITFVFPTYFGDLKGRLWKVDGAERKALVQGNTKKSSSSPLPFSTFLPSFLVNFIWYIRSTVKQRYSTKIFIHEFIDFKGKLTIVNFLSALLGIASILYANLAAKPWWLTNIQGFAVCYSAMQIMSPTTFATGSLILGGLFFYDIWAVFFTPLMVTVAKNLDQPIKLVFPRPDQPSDIAGEPPVKTYSMLGLGDIVLPGLMIGLALRFDLYMFYLKKQRNSTNSKKTDSKDGEKTPYVSAVGHWGDRFWTSRLSSAIRPAQLNVSFPKPYFITSMVGYVVGMLATLGVMSIFQHAQPALLYLVPGVLISVWGAGLVRGELKEMWEFSEAITGEQLDDESSKDEKKDEEEENCFVHIWRGEGKEPEESWLQYIWRDFTKEVKEEAEKEKEKKEKSDEKDSDANNDLLVNFSVTRYPPQASSGGEKKDSKIKTPKKKDHAEGISESVETPQTRSRTRRSEAFKEL